MDRGGGVGPVRAAAGCADPGTAPGCSRDKPGQRALAGGAGGPRLERFPGGKKRVLTRLGENAIYLKIAHKISQMQKNGHFD